MPASPKGGAFWQGDKPPATGSAANTGSAASGTPAASGTSPGNTGEPNTSFPGIVTLPRPQIDEARVARAGIRKLSSKHLDLYTDLPRDAEVDELPQIFDQAVPQWCDYFGLDPRLAEKWQMAGYLIKDKDKFRAVGLLSDSLPPFLYGYARDAEFWVYEQPSSYYRRHLLLHEGTHAFMYTCLRGVGPPWYMEGMAELFGTHRLQDGKLMTKYFPVHKEEVPYWGRIKIVQDGFAGNRALYLQQVFALGANAHFETDNYGWSWAAAAFLNGHPKYRDRFRQLGRQVTDEDFPARFHEQYRTDWEAMCEEWQLFIGGLEYGYDLTRTAIDFQPGQDLPAGGGHAAISADRGWQCAGVRLEQGKSYKIQAQGRYQIAKTSQVWWCEPGGVTIRYYKGRPLGQLLAAIRPDDRITDQPSGLFRVAAIGLNLEVTPTETGILYLKVNDSPAELADNSGTITVDIVPATSATPAGQ